MGGKLNSRAMKVPERTGRRESSERRVPNIRSWHARAASGSQRWSGCQSPPTFDPGEVRKSGAGALAPQLERQWGRRTVQLPKAWRSRRRQPVGGQSVSSLCSCNTAKPQAMEASCAACAGVGDVESCAREGLLSWGCGAGLGASCRTKA